VRPVAALLLLNGLLSFSTWWPTPGIVPDARLAPEFLWLWLALLVLAAAGRASGLAVSALAAAYLLLVLGRYAEVTVPSLFGREINLYWDGAQIPRFLWVTAQEYAWWQSGGVLLAAGLLLAALFSLLRWGIGVALREAAPRALRSRAALALTAAAALLVTANYAGVQATWPLVSKPVVPTYWRQAKILATALSPDRLATVLPETSAVDAAMGTPPREALAGLRGRDVYLCCRRPRRWMPRWGRRPARRSPACGDATSTWSCSSPTGRSSTTMRAPSRRCGRTARNSPRRWPPAGIGWCPPSCARRPSQAPPTWRTSACFPASTSATRCATTCC